MHLSWVTVTVLAGVAFSAGLVDAIAGGGGLLTVPALMSVLPSPHLALGTNKGQSVFGAVASAVSYWRRGGVYRHHDPQHPPNRSRLPVRKIWQNRHSRNYQTTFA